MMNWFRGVVEDRDDPLQLGRLRVRVFGIHTSDKNLIPTADLPWASPVLPITSAAINGIGDTPVGPVPGTWVVGFFVDGKSCQQPVVFGTIPGISKTAANGRIGFNDPAGTYPLENYIGEPDTNRLALGTEDGTIVQAKLDNIDTGVPVALDASETWDEPDPFYAAQYPYNAVRESESGHVFEVDDTPNNERIAWYHRKGTFQEVGPDGTKITKVVTDNYTIVCGDDFAHIRGACNVTIDGDCNLLVNGDLNGEIGGDTNLSLGGDLNATVYGVSTINCLDDLNIQTAGDLNFAVDGDCGVTTANGDVTLTATTGSVYVAAAAGVEIDSNADISINGDSVSISATGTGTVSIECSSDMSIKAEGNLTLDATGEVDLTSTGKTMVTSTGDTVVTSSGNINLVANGIGSNVSVKAKGDISLDPNGTVKVSTHDPLLVGQPVRFVPSLGYL